MADFPTRKQLWKGAVLQTVAHSLFISEGPNDYGVDWDGQNYLRNNGSGDYAAITFGERFTIGVFFGHESRRSPFRNDKQILAYSWRPYFQGAPQAIMELAETEALRYRFEELNGREVGPVITAAFWGEGDVLASAEPWADVWKHGADILALETITNIDEAFAHIEENYEYLDHQLAISRAIYENYLSPDPQFDGAALKHHFNDDGLTLLEAVGIRL